MLCNNCNQPNITQKTLSLQGGAIFEAIWANTALRGNLFPINNTDTKKTLALQEFTQMISTLNNTFFKFITVK